MALYTAKGYGIKWKVTTDFLESWEVAGVIYNSNWAAKNPDLARNFMMAWLRGARDYYKAAYFGPNRKEVVDIAVKYTRVKDPALYDKMNWFYITPNGYVDKRSIQDQISWYYKHGYITAGPPLTKVVDDSYVRHALERIGTVEEAPRR